MASPWITRWLSIAALFVACLGLTPARAAGQLVRGTVRESVSGAALAGVVVELRSATDPRDIRGSAVSAPNGSFAIRSTTPGAYVLAAKRIGVRRYVSEPFSVTPGETVVRDIALEPLLQTLPEVTVSAVNACSANARRVERVAALWDEAQTALLAAQLSLRDQLFQGRITRYVRELESPSLKVLTETRSEVAGVVARPFNAVSVDSLSVRGYWYANPDGRYQYHGPDIDILLSSRFLSEHCLEERPSDSRHRGQVGLAFRPLAQRAVPDLVGTMWLDDKSFELRVVEFSYSRVPVVADSLQTGGEIHFSRLATGAWLVSRWFVRMPLLGRAGSPVTAEQVGTPWVLIRPVSSRLQEEGGRVVVTSVAR